MVERISAVENLGVTVAKVQPAFWQGKKVFVTGHTGFKGSWLSLWLKSMGSDVCGLALKPPTTPSLFEEGRVADQLQSHVGDIRDYETVQSVMRAFDPEIVLHLAAQPLVRYSYKEPIETYATNVMGTVHVLEAARHTNSVRAIVNVTTDKCYENRHWVWGYRECDVMGGHDPYSNSKGCSELVTNSFRNSYFREGSIALASARAGNVVGGGDWAEDRLIPDILRAFGCGNSVVIRNPNATRPWQHVLESLSGYLMLAERLYENGQAFAEGWNFGPEDADVRPVEWIVDYMSTRWGEGARWKLDAASHPHEAALLKLDISKAKYRLNWRPQWDLPKALDRIVDWHRAWIDQADMQAVCLNQIQQYQAESD